MKEHSKNRETQFSVSKEYQRGIKLIDIDTTIAEYMVDTIIPDLEENGNSVKVPLLYGNAERWTGARKDGYLRDQRGKIQIPLVMFKRNSIDRDSNLPQFKDLNTMSTYRKYSKKHRYERFTLMNNSARPFEQYNVSVPDYVTITYEVMIWTSFTEHMNKIVEAFQYATDRYWGKENNYKFRTRIDSFSNQQEVGAGSERVIRTTFTMTVNAYLLPERYDENPTVKKSFSPKRVLFGVETDISGDLFTNPNIYNEYQRVIDFVAIRGSQQTEFVNGTTVKLTNVRLPILPPELVGSFDTENWFRVYINGEFKQPDEYTYSYSGVNKEIQFEFTDLGFDIESDDEVMVTGKFVQL